MADDIPVVAGFSSMVPKFTGEGNADFFFKKLESVATIAKWSDDLKHLIVFDKCTNKAKEFLDKFADPDDNYETLKKLIIDKFRIKETKFSQLLKEFYSNKHGHNESVSEYFDRLNRIERK